MKKGKLFIISGPSGTGKGTICKKLLETEPNLRLSVSVTTRAPRQGEVDGREYHFISAERYLQLLEEGGLLEHASVYGAAMYGTPREPVIDWLQQGMDVILEIDVQGAFQVRENYPDCVLIFILPPSMEELEHRILGRGSETAETMAARLGEAQREIDLSERYDYRVVNEDLEQAVAEVRQIMNDERTEGGL
ncbi:MAG: guanylate kinase [Firmicutes bacterium]|nr:guanylate kinase [Bacillota bacterium]